jgi:flavin-dependent dehydrogenase
VTGQGIYRALISGDIAGKCIAQNRAKKYPYKMYQKFIKWDLVGKNFVRMSHIFRRIGARAVLTASFYFFKISGMTR